MMDPLFSLKSLRIERPVGDQFHLTYSGLCFNCFTFRLSSQSIYPWSEFHFDVKFLKNLPGNALLVKWLFLGDLRGDGTTERSHHDNIIFSSKIFYAQYQLDKLDVDFFDPEFLIRTIGTSGIYFICSLGSKIDLS